MSYREDGSVLLELPMENNNNNTNTAAQPTMPPPINPSQVPNFGLELKAVGIEDGEDISMTTSSTNDNGDDGPLLSGRSLNNQNNNNRTDPRQNSVQQRPDTLHPTNIALELEFPGENELLIWTIYPDGPLLFVLSPDNQTVNDDSTAPGACNSEKPKADALDLTDIVLELDATNDVPLGSETTTNVCELESSILDNKPAFEDAVMETGRCSIPVVEFIKSDPLTLTNKRPGGVSLYAVSNKAEQFWRDDG
ncbi:putative phytanoyl- dioxygenase family protein [Botrytis fragariae]|uniref:Putative phytanoyl- dioxygenase family protein n=1 Tax=Botrytis fragariae TaxID=1964551 RepID=A0A8H6AZ83_9HELO|nr:putative phytanoyl- dioxygenase family protein [Botrytis fragariae]KAF5876217.1 putative phytanoyl- dioxygenase family protein [Botrytis fragariae]